MVKKRIFLDAGHNDSGFDTGAVGNGLREQDITFEVASILGDILKNDFEIKLSRPTKETNLGTNNTTAVNARWQMANEWHADYFVSIHCNASNGQATGAETLYFKNEAIEFAKVIENTYTSEMNLKDRGVKYRDDVAVLRNTTMPSVLIELAFIDNKEDADILKLKKLEIAKAIAKGIYKFLGISQSEEEVQNKENIEEKEVRYQTLEQIPDWGKPTIKKLIALKILQGDEKGLNLSEDMLRIFVIHDRAGIYKE